MQQQQESAPCARVQGGPVRGGDTSTLSQMEHGNPQREAGGWPTAGGAGGRLTKASLALLKAFTSCGARDLNWAMGQPLAPWRALRGVGTGTAPILVSTVVISISTRMQPTGKSVLQKERPMRAQTVSGPEGGGWRVGVTGNDVGAHPASSSSLSLVSVSRGGSKCPLRGCHQGLFRVEI